MSYIVYFTHFIIRILFEVKENGNQKKRIQIQHYELCTEYWILNKKKNNSKIKIHWKTSSTNYENVLRTVCCSPLLLHLHRYGFDFENIFYIIDRQPDLAGATLYSFFHFFFWLFFISLSIDVSSFECIHTKFPLRNIDQNVITIRTRSSSSFKCFRIRLEWKSNSRQSTTDI